MDRLAVKAWIETYGELTFSRSSGPGGQNVNKVNSRTQLRVGLLALAGISELERARLLEKLSSRLIDGDILQIAVQDERSQLLNRELAVERMLETLAEALHRDKPRRKTKPTKASKERRLTAKKRTSTNKNNRIVSDD